MQHFIKILFLTVTMISCVSFANIRIEPPRSFLIGNAKADAKERSLSLSISNTESESIQLTPKLQEILNPNSPTEKQVTIKNGQNLLLTPAIINLSSKATKKINVSFVGKDSITSEKVYIIDVDMTSETLKQLNSNKPTATHKPTHKGHVRFLIKQAALVHLLPSNIIYGYTLHKNNNHINVTNTGNTHIRLLFNSCTPKTLMINGSLNPHCAVETSVYPGKSYTYDLAHRKTTLTISKRKGFPGKFKTKNMVYDG